METEDITKSVSERTKELQPRFDRMDDDFNRWDMHRPKSEVFSEYVGEVFTPTRDTDIEVRSNAPRTFSDDVQSILSSSERQIIVRMAETQGEDKREQMGKLERLLEFAFQKADERLINLLHPTFKESSVWYSIVRGWIAGRFLVYRGGKDIVFDFLPYDPRWLVYQLGANGISWSAYTTSYSPEELEDEYGKDVTEPPWYKPWEKSKESYDVIDYWKNLGEGKVINAILCNKTWLKKPEEYNMD